jgi:hypothetical protein
LFNSVLVLSPASAGPVEGTVFELVAQMGLFAKIVLIILLFLSVVSWAITFNKIGLFRKVNRETERFLTVFRKRTNLDQAYLSCVSMRRTPLSKMLEAGYKELVELSKKQSFSWLRPEISLRFSGCWERCGESWMPSPASE